MKRKKVLFFHEIFTYTYYIKVKVNCKDCDDEKIYNKIKDYLYNHDRNSHLKSVKEIDEKQHILRYYILYFTDKELNYSKVQKKMFSNAFIHIQLVPKRKEDIENVIKFMEKIKKNNKTNSVSTELKIENSNLKFEKPKLSIFNFKTS